jgi:hypothetical protein
MIDEFSEELLSQLSQSNQTYIRLTGDQFNFDRCHHVAKQTLAEISISTDMLSMQNRYNLVLAFRCVDAIGTFLADTAFDRTDPMMRFYVRRAARYIKELKRFLFVILRKIRKTLQ